MLFEHGSSSSPRSDAPEYEVDKSSYRGRKQDHQNSWQTEECLNPVKGIRDWQQRNGIQPHNHHRDNVAAIRAKSTSNRLLRQREAEQAASASPPFTPQLSTRTFATPKPRRGSQQGEKDFIYQNALATQAASVTARSRRHTTEEDEGRMWLQKEAFGRVPSYLQVRKLELAEKHAAEQNNRLANLVPPGMRIMPEEERVEMLEMLQKGKKDVEAKIQALPFVIETPSQLQRQKALHKRLEEIEEACRLFSRQTVLVEL